jgi:hypothetical protein
MKSQRMWGVYEPKGKLMAVKSTKAQAEEWTALDLFTAGWRVVKVIVTEEEAEPLRMERAMSDVEAIREAIIRGDDPYDWDCDGGNCPRIRILDPPKDCKGCDGGKRPGPALRALDALTGESDELRKRCEAAETDLADLMAEVETGIEDGCIDPPPPVFLLLRAAAKEADHE